MQIFQQIAQCRFFSKQLNVDYLANSQHSPMQLNVDSLANSVMQTFKQIITHVDSTANMSMQIIQQRTFDYSKELNFFSKELNVDFLAKILNYRCSACVHESVVFQKTMTCTLQSGLFSEQRSKNVHKIHICDLEKWLLRTGGFHPH